METISGYKFVNSVKSSSLSPFARVVINLCIELECRNDPRS